ASPFPRGTPVRMRGTKYLLDVHPPAKCGSRSSGQPGNRQLADDAGQALVLQGALAHQRVRAALGSAASQVGTLIRAHEHQGRLTVTWIRSQRRDELEPAEARVLDARHDKIERLGQPAPERHLAIVTVLDLEAAVLQQHAVKLADRRRMVDDERASLALRRSGHYRNTRGVRAELAGKVHHPVAWLRANGF